MEKNYWLHRINHISLLSDPLLEAGYLSYGYQKLSGSDLHNQLQSAKTEDEKQSIFDTVMRENNITSRSRFSLWRFLSFDCGDIVIVPRPKAFDVFRIKGKAFSVTELASRPYPAGLRLPSTVELTIEGFKDKQSGEIYDIGYLAEVEEIRRNIPRSFAQTPLVSRMKTRDANADINDLKAEVEAALSAEKEVSIHDVALKEMCSTMKDIIRTNLTPEQFEKLVCWYFEKKGASRVFIPAKNEAGKKNGADADVIAEFDDLCVIFYVQVKEHVGKTDEWGVTQIKEYKDHLEMSDGYTYIPWVISTAEFTDEAKAYADDNGIRLISGDGFTAMLLDCGIDTIDQAFEKSYPTK